MEEGGGETHAPPASLTLGGILSIKQTPPYRIHDRTLLDLIRDDQTSKETRKTWKMLREKIRLKLAGSVCTTAVPTLASHVHISSTSNRMPVTSPRMVNTSRVQETETVSLEAEADSPVPEEDRDGREPVRMSLMSLLEVDESSYLDDDIDEAEAEAEKVVAVVEDGGVDDGGGGGGGYKYNNCCVCMVRHKSAAFIPCGHTFCRLCSRELFVKRATCPLCNHFILEILDIF